MNKFYKLVDYIINDPKHILLSVLLRISPIVPDKLYLQLTFRLIMGYKLNLDNPQTFNEKVQWLKLYNRRLEYTRMVDKYAAKEYVSENIGQEYIIPTLGVYKSASEIDFEKLPNQFVLKCTHDSGLVFICRDKSSFNRNNAIKKLNKSLKRNYYWLSREFPYKNVPPRVIAEKYMGELGAEDMIDYKFFCFNGEPEYCQVIKDRSTHETIDFFDKNWQHQEFYGLTQGVKQSLNPIQKPQNYDKMLDIARVLSRNIPFVRVDLYNVNGKIYFGEMTFFPNGGFGTFTPQKWNQILGDMLVLPVDCNSKRI